MNDPKYNEGESQITESGDWTQVYYEFNAKQKQLEILAVGKINDKHFYKAKAIPYSEVLAKIGNTK